MPDQPDSTAQRGESKSVTADLPTDRDETIRSEYEGNWNPAPCERHPQCIADDGHDAPHEFVLTGDVLAVGCRNVEPMEFWVIELSSTVRRTCRFLVVGTGHPLPPGAKYVGTAVAPGGGLVWHLMEV